MRRCSSNRLRRRLPSPPLRTPWWSCSSRWLPRRTSRPMRSSAFKPCGWLSRPFNSSDGRLVPGEPAGHRSAVSRRPHRSATRLMQPPPLPISPSVAARTNAAAPLASHPHRKGPVRFRRDPVEVQPGSGGREEVLQGARRALRPERRRTRSSPLGAGAARDRESEGLIRERETLSS